MRKADYTYEIKNDVVSIIDLNLGNLSVTNDIENILTEINKTKNIIGKRVTYRDSEEEWSDFLADVKYYLLPSSDTAMHKRAKVVMAMDSIYRSVGYSHDSKKGEFYCILFVRNIGKRNIIFVFIFR